MFYYLSNILVVEDLLANKIFLANKILLSKSEFVLISRTSFPILLIQFKSWLL